MPRKLRFHPFGPALPALIGLLMAVLIGSAGGAGNGALRALIVGGGPEPQHNQVAIERNVHYVSKLLPTGVPRTILFADGDPASKTVLYEEQPRELSPGEHAFALLFGTVDEATPTVHKFRAPQLGRLDGPARRAAVDGAFARLRQGEGPVLLYFTGHGSRARDGNLDDNSFDLWGERLSVRELAAHIAALPADVPVTLVMVQCFSGAFGNLIFSAGDPAAPLVNREIAGFYATTRERWAAGCTPEVNEAEYRDFTSYFFAALSGRDRVGRRVTGADYNHDGRVGMDEAFAYSLIHDASIDVPVCTSDVLLRRAVPGTDPELFRADYSPVRAWATPAQGAALDALSSALKLSGEARLSDGYRMLTAGPQRGGSRSSTGAPDRRFNQAHEEARRSLLDRWPELKQQGSRGYAVARTQAVAELARRAADGRLRELLAAEEALAKAEEDDYQAELAGARVLRFCRLAKSVILAHRLRESGDAATRDRFERLFTAESGTLLPPASVAVR